MGHEFAPKTDELAAHLVRQNRDASHHSTEPAGFHLLHLQRVIGNQNVQRALTSGALIQRGHKSTKEKAKKKFKNLPDNAIAICGESYAVPNVPIGQINGLLSIDFYSVHDHTPMGDIDLSGVQDNQDNDSICSYFSIENRTDPRLPKAGFLVAWYLTKHMESTVFQIRTISEAFAEIMAQVGMTLTTDGNNSEGDSETVYTNALRLLKQFGWVMRNE